MYQSNYQQPSYQMYHLNPDTIQSKQSIQFDFNRIISSRINSTVM